MVDLANGSMSFEHVCREWRCKYDGDKATSESLEAIAKVVEEYLPVIKETASKDAKVNRLVCGGCLDFVRISFRCETSVKVLFTGSFFSQLFSVCRSS
jgi:hypothetical protein